MPLLPPRFPDVQEAAVQIYALRTLSLDTEAPPLAEERPPFPPSPPEPLNGRSGGGGGKRRVGGSKEIIASCKVAGWKQKDSEVTTLCLK